ncbi:MAG TPA: CvpA family protein [Bauldia sp.]|nr:CvpA family protein [Bauldia sp.]
MAAARLKAGKLKGTGALTLLDLIVLIVVLISALLAMVRGFVREVLSIASWIIAAGAAYFLYKPLVPLVSPYIESDTVAKVIAAAVVFVIAVIVASYVTTKISDYVIDSRVGAVDRIFGLLFGAARGVLLLVIALAFFDWLVSKPPAWVSDSRSAPVLTALGGRLMDALPPDAEAKLMAFFHKDDSGAPPAGDNSAQPDDSGSGTSSTADTPGSPTYDATARQNMDNLIQGTSGGN